MRATTSTGKRARARLRGVRAVVGLLLMALLATGCDFSVYGLPLPGGAATGDDTYEVTVEFVDVLDLVPQSAVKVDDVSVGQVEEVKLVGANGRESGALRGSVAKVRIKVRGSVDLPRNATARIRQTSLLGEKFVSLAPPVDGAPAGRLGSGDTIPLSRTGRNTEVEEVLSALSLLLNGGGVAQLKTISQELNNALGGREDAVRKVLRELRTFVAKLDSDKAKITKAIEELNRLSARLVKQRKTIERTLDEVPASLKILADQRAKLTKMLQALSKLGDVGTRVITGTRADLVANLKSIDPILTELAKSGKDLPNSLEVLFTYPFADSATNAIKGDYTNLQLTLDLDLRHLTGPDGPIPDPTLPPLPLPTDVPTLPVPTLPVPTAPPRDPDAPRTPAPTSTGGPCVPLPPLLDCPGAGSRSTPGTSGAPNRRADDGAELAAHLLAGTVPS